MRLLSSQFQSSGPLVMTRSANLIPPGIEPILGWNGQAVGRDQVLYPRHIPGYGTRMLPLHRDQMPRNWQTVTARQPMRLATCEEVRCPNFRHGWTRVVTPDGNSTSMEGAFSQDQANAMFGSTRGVTSAVFPQPPGTPCYLVHKIPTGIPPLYQVNGRWTLWNEFEDALGGGVHQMAKISKEGRY